MTRLIPETTDPGDWLRRSVQPFAAIYQKLTVKFRRA
jgi:hypothetical protein